MRTLLFALVLLASATCALAQDEISLQQALRLGLQQNPQLAGYSFRRDALAGEAQSARLRPETAVQFEAENLAGSGAKSGVKAAEFTLSFGSVVELGGQRDARMGAVTARQQQLASEQRMAVLDVVAGVNYRFIALLAAQEQSRLAQEAWQLAQSLAESLDKRVQAGSTPKAELMRARAAVARTEIALDKARQQLREQALSLSAYWAEPNPAFSRASGDLFRLPALESLAGWQARLAQNPDLALLADATRLRAAELRKAEAEGKLALGWSAGVRQSQDTSDTALVVGVNIPLASGRRAAGAIQVARAEQDAAELAETSARTRLQTRLQQTYAAHQQALAEVENLRERILPLLQESSRDTTAAFNQGRYSSLELAMAQRELLEARAELISAALRAHETRIELERLTASAAYTEVTP
ncbi:TolC family protein [Cellvibrio japonicus]|nr:TolC family protein [Cellvibrio japonicus]QEI13892.1 TolC family protein [Cellvibrio japonicus]QEI17466.1 TolC family protein [Cellvibrio japonicus]QEI21042.1 TolC family protein [Cellvibrio japonicus]